MAKNRVMLITIDENWADEMDLQSFALFTEKAWKDHLKLVKELFKKSTDEVSMGIGSNQELYFDNFQDYKKRIKTKAVSSAEIRLIKSNFKVEVNKTAREGYLSVFGVKTLFDGLDLDEMLYDEDGNPYETID